MRCSLQGYFTDAGSHLQQGCGNVQRHGWTGSYYHRGLMGRQLTYNALPGRQQVQDADSDGTGRHCQQARLAAGCHSTDSLPQQAHPSVQRRKPHVAASSSQKAGTSSFQAYHAGR